MNISKTKEVISFSGGVMFNVVEDKMRKDVDRDWQTGKGEVASTNTITGEVGSGRAFLSSDMFDELDAVVHGFGRINF